MLGKAEARQTASRREPSSKPTEPKTAIHPRSPHHAAQETSTARPERPADAVSREQDKPTQQATGACKDEQKQDQAFDDRQDAEEHPEERSTPVQDAMVMAMNAPAAAAPLPTAQGGTNVEPGEPTGQETDKAITAVGATGVDTTVTSAATTTPSTPAAAPATAAAVSNTTTVAPAEKQERAEQPSTGNVPSDQTVATSETKTPRAVDAPTANAGEPVASEKTDPDTVKSAVAAMTMMKRDTQTAPPVVSDNADRATIMEAFSQRQTMTGAQGASGAEQHLARDSGQFSESSGESNRPAANVLPAGDGNSRNLFLDRMNGLGASTAPVNDGAAGGRDSGQSAPLARAMDTGRSDELHGATPFTQSVTLDLDPLDMGPLRVRVMMNDQTVHAHIRTEHGELGQGLLQQGQSLESSLRTTGLEMGMLRVTVDQQQGRGDNAWMFQQQPQQQGRPSNPTLSQTPAREDERGARGERTAGSNERVSFFA